MIDLSRYAFVALRKDEGLFFIADAATSIVSVSCAFTRNGTPYAGKSATAGVRILCESRAGAGMGCPTVIMVSQGLSGEIVLEKLIDTLMRNSIEYACAEFGWLLLPRGIEQQIEAEAITSGDSIIVRSREASVAAAPLPASIIHYVERAREIVIFDDASDRNPFSADPYIAQHRANSMLCLPLINQARLIGGLYLENNLTSHVFS